MMSDVKRVWLQHDSTATDGDGHRLRPVVRTEYSSANSTRLAFE
jgi:hypothetical protein